ncbi:MAG: alpha-D-ribose 1-methylphosphonate 5-triphosphate diphosphatase [Aestuariivirga sp.]
MMPLDSSAGPDLTLSGGVCLIPGEGLRPATLHCSGGRIAEVTRDRPPRGHGDIEMRGALVLPGAVDIHGDAFERQIMPRPRTMFPLDIALVDTDRQLAANGITTAYHGVTVSWEPGLRSLAEAQRIIAALDDCRDLLCVDHRIHIRWETFAIDAIGSVTALFSRVDRPLLAFNDHTTPTLAGGRQISKIKGAAERAMVEPDVYMKLVSAIAERSGEVPAAIRRIASAARDRTVPMLSHDDSTPQMRQSYRDLGASVAEFPLNGETAEAAALAGDDLVLGAPNVVRGGSHNGAIGAEDAVRRGWCSILASDYYYPAPVQAAYGLIERDVLPIDRAWDLISGAPARAAGLKDRGQLATGARADIVVIPQGSVHPVLTLVAGKVAYSRL